MEFPVLPGLQAPEVPLVLMDPMGLKVIVDCLVSLDQLVLWELQEFQDLQDLKVNQVVVEEDLKDSRVEQVPMATRVLLVDRVQMELMDSREMKVSLDFLGCLDHLAQWELKAALGLESRVLKETLESRDQLVDLDLPDLCHKLDPTSQLQGHQVSRAI
jgi:hypothetical protein